MPISNFLKLANARTAGGGAHPNLRSTRSLDHWRSIETSMGVFLRYRAPICAAAEDLGGQLYARVRSGIDPAALVPTGATEVRDGAPFVGTGDALGAFLGWAERYRGEARLLGPERIVGVRQLDSGLRNILSMLGEADEAAAAPDLIAAARALPTDPARARALVAFLVDLMEALLPGRLDQTLVETASRWLGDFERSTGRALSEDAALARSRLDDAANGRRPPARGLALY